MLWHLAHTIQLTIHGQMISSNGNTEQFENPSSKPAKGMPRSGPHSRPTVQVLARLRLDRTKVR